MIGVSSNGKTAAFEAVNGGSKPSAPATLWDLARTHFHELDPVLQKMGEHGSRIDLEVQDQLRERLKKELRELNAEVQQHVPSNLYPTKVWKKRPQREVSEIHLAGVVKICLRCGLEITSKIAHQKGKKNPCKGATVGKCAGVVTAFEERLPFNPLSSPQMLRYCAFFKHKVGIDPKTHQPTANVKVIKGLQKAFGKQHPIYGLTLKIRARRKVLSTYLFKPDSKGLAHGWFRNNPWTMRLSQEKHSFMNISKRGSALYADDIRRQIIPCEGHIFIGADCSSIQAVMLARLAGDTELEAIARKGLHAYTACREIGWEFTPENIQRIKEEYKTLYEQKKTTSYLTLFAGTPPMLHAGFPESFPTIAAARKEQDQFFECCPAIKDFWFSIMQRAKRDGFIQSPWGIRVDFPYVYRRNPDDPTKLIPGEDRNDSIAFLPQHCEAMFARECLLIFGRSWLGTMMPSHGFHHDGFTFCIPVERAENAEDLIERVLTRAIPQLGNLRVGCEIERCEIGGNWGPFIAENDPKVLSGVKTANPRGMRTVKVVTV